VTLLAGPGVAGRLPGVRMVSFESTAELAELLKQHFSSCDVLIMAAAVADYRPCRLNTGKMPRRRRRVVLELERTPDLVAECAAHKRADQRIVGFALEEPRVLARRARQKLRRKGLDAVVGNPLETMGADRIQALVYTAAGAMIQPPSRRADGLSKTAFARWLIRWIGADLTAPKV
jgi:phosphopantothenoylcysteine decarboxylase/phosphopantothenate--cysteine ligase